MAAPDSFRRAHLEGLQQIPVTPLEVIKHLGQLTRGHSGLKPKNPVGDLVGAGSVHRVEIPRLARGLNRSDDNPGWVWVEVQHLMVQELELRDHGPLVRCMM